ncbi:SCO family protein [Babesia caballi]|uniref:SCO family protein n=1 Tax=Babesia caballi TaxID=5871 RepID=A0AAV4LXH0_BABCB|nr:SCO family protein [Babesia caballi]
MTHAADVRDGAVVDAVAALQLANVLVGAPRRAVERPVVGARRSEAFACVDQVVEHLVTAEFLGRVRLVLAQLFCEEAYKGIAGDHLQMVY